MKKVILKVSVDETTKQKVMRSVSSIQGVDTISIDMKNQKLTVVGDIDPVDIVNKLRKNCQVEILSVGPAKEEKKKEAQQEEKKPEAKKDEKKKDDVAELLKAYQAYNPYSSLNYQVKSEEQEKDPHACALC